MVSRETSVKSGASVQTCAAVVGQKCSFYLSELPLILNRGAKSRLAHLDLFSNIRRRAVWSAVAEGNNVQFGGLISSSTEK